VSARTILLTLTLLSTGVSAYAQNVEPPPTSCWAVAIKGAVLVTKVDGTVQKGTLVCLGSDQAVLAGIGAIPLDSIRRIAKPRDGIVDGVLKGASIGLIFLFGCVDGCDAGIVARATLSYAAIGGVIDAAQGNNATIFGRSAPAPSVAWRLRF
jgi:hypothetical protein